MGRVAPRLLQVLGVTVGHHVIVLRLVKLHHLVGRVQPLGPQPAGVGIAGDRLSGAANAAAGAGHDFDQVVLALPAPHLLDHVHGVLQSVDHRQLKFHLAGRDGGLAQPVLAADVGKIDRVERHALQRLHRVAQHGLGHAAACAKNDPGAGLEPQRHVERLRFKISKPKASLLNHPGKLLCREHVIDLGPAVGGKLRQLGLELLRRAGHDRHHDQVVGRHAQPLGQNPLGQRAKHLLRRPAARQVVEQVGAKLLGKLHPARAARSELRQALAAGLAIDKLVGLLDHGQIGGETGVVHGLEAQGLQGGDDPPDLDVSGRQPESLAQGNANGRRDLRHHGLSGGIERLPNRLGLRTGRQRTGGANRGAQPAVDAFHVLQVFAKRRQHAGRGAAESEIDHADALNLFARPHAVAAQDALVRIAHQRDAGTIDRLRLVGRFESHLVHTQPPRQLLQLAGRAFGAGRAVLLVIGQDQLQGDLPHLPNLFGVRPHPHARFRRCGATGHDAPSLDLDQAQPAGAIDAQLRVIAKRGDVDAGIPGQFEQIAFPVDRNHQVVECQSRLHVHR